MPSGAIITLQAAISLIVVYRVRSKLLKDNILLGGYSLPSGVTSSVLFIPVY